MKPLRRTLAALVLLALVACSAAQKQEEKNVLNWAQTQCLMANPALEPPALVVACAIDIALTPYVEQFLTAYRGQLAAARDSGVKGCPPPPPQPAQAASAAPAPPVVAPCASSPVAPPPSASNPPPAPKAPKKGSK